MVERMRSSIACEKCGGAVHKEGIPRHTRQQAVIAVGLLFLFQITLYAAGYRLVAFLVQAPVLWLLLASRREVWICSMCGYASERPPNPRPVELGRKQAGG